MKRLAYFVCAAAILTTTLSPSTLAGTMVGARASRTGTIVGARTGNIVGARTGNITGARTGNISGTSMNPNSEAVDTDIRELISANIFHILRLLVERPLF